MAKLLIVDDDRQVVDLLQSALSRYDSTFAKDGCRALQQVDAEKPNLVLMDLKLPDIDGILLITKIRETSNVPIIVLSGRHEQVDIVSALNNGADDFLKKPFDIDDLEARVETVLRRSKVSDVPTDVYTVGSLRISRLRIALLSGSEFYLTPIEHRILLLLAMTPDQLVTYDQFYEQVWGGTDGQTVQMIMQHVMRIRLRMRDRRGAPTLSTVRGRGFMLRAAPE